MKQIWLVVCVAALWALAPSVAGAGQQQGAIEGVVLDAVGGRVAGASVTVVGSGRQAGETTSGGDGRYASGNLPPGRYQVVVRARGFETWTSESVYVGAGASQVVDATLHVGPLQQAVVVTASASEIPQSQTGAPVTVLDSRTLEALNTPDVLDALRLVPGAQVVQAGARGSQTSLFIRGGAANFNKVLLDGVAVNDIGGDFDYAQWSATGIDRVEVLRQTNSVMYGSDALAGVVALTTTRGSTRVPSVIYTADGGNLGTVSTGASAGGLFKRVDYFSAFSRFSTDNDLPNNHYRNHTYAGRFGVAIGNATEVSGTIRAADAELGSPNAVPLYGIPDDASQDNEMASATLGVRSQLTSRWQTSMRVGMHDQTSHFLDPSPTGEDPLGFGVYLGQPVTVRGPEGRVVSGRAILNFGGTYPLLSEHRTTRKTLSGEATYEVAPWLSVSGGGRYEHEQGYGDPDAEPTATRHNGGAFVEGRGTFMNRHYISAGMGVEHNEVFGEAFTPRVSVASYLRRPSQDRVGETKLVLNAGTGIKAPSLFQQQSSLFELVKGTPAAAGIAQVGPERARSVDIGIEQAFARGRARARVAYFHNTFDDLLEFLGKASLPRAGVPVDVANATDFGAYINSQSYRARGVETSFEVAPRSDLRVRASYMRLDVEVTEAFSASESFNPAFPGVAIGAFSPLVGARPFRRPANSGDLIVIYAPGRLALTLSAYVAGRNDDSTFLTDGFFGGSLLLPNTDLNAGHEKIDLSGSYQVHPRLCAYANIENLLDQDYQPAFGFAALPLTARVGVRVTLGGD